MFQEAPEFDMSDVYSSRVGKPYSVGDRGHVIQIHTHEGNKCCYIMYDNDTLEDLYKKCYEVFFRTVIQAAKLKPMLNLTVRDVIPEPMSKNIDKYHVDAEAEEENAIYDIFVCDKAGSILSIPCDPAVKFRDFKTAHEQYFVPSTKIPVLRVYKIYMVTDKTIVFLQKRNIEEQQYSVMNRLKRYINCAV